MRLASCVARIGMDELTRPFRSYSQQA